MRQSSHSYSHDAPAKMNKKEIIRRFGSYVPSLLVVFGTVGLIATVTYTHAYIPLISSLYSLQLPLCLYLFVVVKTVVHLVGNSPEQTRAPSLPEVYTCVQVMVSEMYVVFLMMLAAKLTLQGGHA